MLETKKEYIFLLVWRKVVSCGGTIVSNNKPGNCHYTPLCCFFSNKLRTNPELLLFQISSEQNFLLVSADKTPLNSQYMQNLKTFNRMIKLQSPLSLENRKTYAFVWISSKWSLWNVNCNYSVIALKLSFDISILLGYSRFQSLDIYYKASWNIVQEIKLLLLFAYNTPKQFCLFNTMRPIQTYFTIPTPPPKLVPLFSKQLNISSSGCIHIILGWPHLISLPANKLAGQLLRGISSSIWKEWICPALLVRRLDHGGRMGSSARDF